MATVFWGLVWVATVVTEPVSVEPPPPHAPTAIATAASRHAAAARGVLTPAPCPRRPLEAGARSGFARAGTRRRARRSCASQAHARWPGPGGSHSRGLLCRSDRRRGFDCVGRSRVRCRRPRGLPPRPAAEL